MPEGGWDDFGLLIRAESDVTLVSVRFPNQGLADVIELRSYPDSALLDSIPVPAGDTNATVNINYPLKSQELYSLVATTPDNRYYGDAQDTYAFPAGNADITVLSSFCESPYPYAYWFSFNDIVTQPYTPELGAVIDIKPGSDVNRINLKSRGVVPVAVLTTDDFNATDIDPQSVIFAGAYAVRWQIEDVDGDGDDDILFHFRTQDLNIDDFTTAGLTVSVPGSAAAVLTGGTFEGIPFSGSDSVDIVPKR
ncbi:MAG: hypothetical protein P8013_09410 [Candidatus Sulfobium sp.]